MSRLLKIFLVAAFTLAGFTMAGSALAGAGGDPGINDAEDDITSSTDQGGSSSSGDAVGGQVVGVVSAGDASVDSTNRSEDVDIETGEASAVNGANQTVGQTTSAGGGGNELEDGEISGELSQAAEAASGDGVGGTVIGVVTSAGGSADVVAANTSEDVDVETGDAFADNNVLFGFVGQDSFVDGSNTIEDGDISGEAAQTASAASGDGVGGQVLGIVSAGDASIDGTNRSEDVDVETGDASAANDLEPEVDQATGTGGGDNELEDADISSEASQDASAGSGDGVAGQVIGAVTSAGGTADVVAANTSEDVDVETGEADASNFLENVVGQGNFEPGENDAEDDISFEGAHTASAVTGDGVGGQVLGIVSAGDASVDATNESTDVDIATGDAFANNNAIYRVGQENLGGDNFSDSEISSQLAQDASANSGDAVAGQVAGVVTSAGGSADLVLANTSEDVDAESGFSEFVNDSEEFVGQQTEVEDL